MVTHVYKAIQDALTFGGKGDPLVDFSGTEYFAEKATPIHKGVLKVQVIYLNCYIKAQQNSIYWK